MDRDLPALLLDLLLDARLLELLDGGEDFLAVLLLEPELLLAELERGGAGLAELLLELLETLVGFSRLCFAAPLLLGGVTREDPERAPEDDPLLRVVSR